MRRSSPRLLSLAIAAPPLAIIIWLFFIPFLSSVHLSFLRDGQWTLRNYYLVWRLYKFDVLYTLGLSVVSLILVIGIAVLLCGYLRIVGHRAVEFLFKVPLFVPFVVVGHGMRVLLAPRGTLNSALAQVGLIDLADPPSIAFGWGGIVVSLVWKNLALAVLLVLGAYRAVDEAFLEAARNVGASTFRQITDILLPMAAPSLVVASAFMFTSMLASFSIPLMIGSGEPPQMLMVDVYYRINYQDDLGTANALGMVSYLLAMGVAGYYLRTITAKAA
ncbi:MAG TPA: ABC transporter permease subunit [Methylomirabilota bacterium]|jgi:ABC-type Fe3+ transport system permease subunit|nr:ABC transporter permease subunit [Methylomirabilota bacterium]